MSADLASLTADFDNVKQQLDWLKRQLFGRKSEKQLDVDPALQGNLLATGSVDGSVYMLELCEGLAAMQSNEKQSVMQASMGGLAWPVPSACFCAAHVVGLCWARALSARLPTLAYNHRCIHVHLLLSPRLPTNSVAYVFRLCWAYVRSI